MTLETRIKDLKENHFLPLKDMTRGTFDFYCEIMNQAQPSFRAYTIRLTPERYMVIPYEVLHAKDSPCDGFMLN